jgi:hypothetical protein
LERTSRQTGLDSALPKASYVTGATGAVDGDGRTAI